MKHPAGVVIIGLGAVLLAGAGIGDAQEKAPPPIAGFARYSGTAKIQAPAGAARSLRIEVKDWHLERTEQAIRVPITGFYIVQLTSGHIDTELAGTRTSRRPGDIWTVASGQSMSLFFPRHSQTVHLQTIAVNPAGVR